ncbi:uncharacterized protein VTP21DRAFT_10477 [Calcarisporiella thermophila]|uniref:uncharacterized protein n=1 Tax=Calcarisporiella thermophila TaxID=911321 RepID=UPI0037420F9B
MSLDGTSQSSFQSKHAAGIPTNNASKKLKKYPVNEPLQKDELNSRNDHSANKTFKSRDQSRTANYADDQSLNLTSSTGRDKGKSRRRNRQKSNGRQINGSMQVNGQDSRDNIPTEESVNGHTGRVLPKTNSRTPQTNQRISRKRDRPMVKLSESLTDPQTSKNEEDTSFSITQDTETSQAPVEKKAPRVRARRWGGAKLDPAEIKDLQTSLTHELSSSKYECMVCWDVIRPRHQTWSCNTCWAVFHVNCINKWAKRSLEETAGTSTGWRCPGCQTARTSVPKGYFCFCGKQRNPELNRYITPHSCGQLCGRNRNCPHECVLPCHPGPCPPCTAMAPPVVCYCGKETFNLRCVDTDYSTGKSCDQVCGEMLGCEKHYCAQKCHPGLCPPCKIQETQSCYCGSHTRQALCGSGDPSLSFIAISDAISENGMENPDNRVFVSVKEVFGHFSCQEQCGQLFACGQHRCKKKCHPIESPVPKECPFSPELVRTCPCGKASVTSLLPRPREACTDEIPLCGSTCDKILTCGHPCAEQCHYGECPPCKRTVQVPCRCGATQFERLCCEIDTSQGGEAPFCDKVCRKLKNCGRHQCGQKCCATNSVNSIAGIPIDLGVVEEDAHTCKLICGKRLKCKVHTCSLLCHKGHCPPCLNANFDELSCHCGRTRLLPPIPCGTKLPNCPYPCQRPPTCNHPRLLSHSCHSDDEPCPPCVYLVKRRCLCGRTEVPNIHCHKGMPSCGRVCGKLLPCGGHTCQRVCHAGDCQREDVDVICAQTCGKPQPLCGHPCTEACHAPAPCPEATPCQTKVLAICQCGRLKKEVKCGAYAGVKPANTQPLPCDDSCMLAERNKRLAMALEIDENKRSTDPASGGWGLGAPEYEELLVSTCRSNLEWVKRIENMLADFLLHQPQKPVLNLPPMKGPQRKFIHELCAHYRLQTESVDVDPYRSVVVRKRSDSIIPSVLLSQAAFSTTRKRSSSSTLASTEAAGGEILDLKSLSGKPPVNALYLADLAFGITQDELTHKLAPAFTREGGVKYSIRWVADDDAAIVFDASTVGGVMDEFELMVWRLKQAVKILCIEQAIAGHVEACWVNSKWEVVWPGGKNPFHRAKEMMKLAGSSVMPKPATTVNVFDALADVEGEGWNGSEEKKVATNAWSDGAANTLVNVSVSDSGSDSIIPVEAKNDQYVPTELSQNRDDGISSGDMVPDDWEQLEE